MSEQHPHRTYLAIDGGGTRTSAVIVDAGGQEVARAEAGTSNPAVIGFDAAIAVLTGLIREVTGEAPTAPVRAWAGLSGFGRAADHERVRPALTALVPDLRLTNDVELVLGALPGQAGVALIAGTGSIVAGRNEAGDDARVGGWGHLFGDEGSGYDMGRETLRAIARQIDGRGPETSLTTLLFEEWKIADPYEIISRAYDPTMDKAAIARLSRLPLEQTYRHDAVATEIVHTAAGHLAGQVLTAARRLGFTDRLPLAMTGGIMVHHLIMRDLVLDRLRQAVGQVDAVVVIDPALSAARSLAGIWGIPT